MIPGQCLSPELPRIEDVLQPSALESGFHPLCGRSSTSYELQMRLLSVADFAVLPSQGFDVFTRLVLDKNASHVTRGTIVASTGSSRDFRKSVDAL